MLRISVVSYPCNDMNYHQTGQMSFLSQNLTLTLLGSGASFRTPVMNTSGTFK